MADPTALYEKLLATLDGEEFQPRCANDPPWFCGAEEYKTAVAALRAVVELHKPVACNMCRSTSHRVCDECGQPINWPCPTTRSVAEALGVSLDG